jgi:hypothetical protein
VLVAGRLDQVGQRAAQRRAFVRELLDGCGDQVVAVVVEAQQPRLDLVEQSDVPVHPLSVDTKPL